MNAPHVIACPHCGEGVDVSEVGVGVEISCPHCHHPFLAADDFGPYRLEGRLGSGGSSTLYRATDTDAGRPVAVKILHHARAADPRWVETFLREAKVTASLRHPGIVRILDWGRIGERPYQVMELLEGGSLEQRLAGGARLGEGEALHLGLEIASALRLAGAHGLVHRDIKPGNILFGPGGAPKLVDFGLCQAANALAEGDAPVFGTPYYLPPERLQREPEDARSDIYSLGATLYHALAGRPPYPEPDPAKIAACHEAGPPPRLREVAPDVSDETARIVDRCLARAPQARFPSYDELLARLAEAKRLHQRRTPPSAKLAPRRPGDKEAWRSRGELPADYRRRSRSGSGRSSASAHGPEAQPRRRWLLALLLFFLVIAALAATAVFYVQGMGNFSPGGILPSLDGR